MRSRQATIELRRRQAKPVTLAGIPDWLARVYATRGIVRDRDLDYRLAGLARPDALSGLNTALSILEEAVMAGAHLVLVGDYDTDGATSCALAVGALHDLGAAEVDYLVPNRVDFGYGLSPEIVRVAAGRYQPDVLITVDNGIASHAGVLAARELGIVTVVTDHHLPGESLPLADAIVNPNSPGDAFPSKNLAGVGVIFYVMLALRTRLRNAGWFARSRFSEPNLADYLDLVALGTVADMVTLDHNNRILVAQGLSRIRAGRLRPGLRALLETAGRVPDRLGSRDLAFSVAPRLNAAGRLEDMSVGIECLLSDDMDRARRLAAQLDEINTKRRAMQSDMVAQAEAAVTELTLDSTPSGITLFDASWHQGLVGLIAGRVTELTARPAIAFASAGEGELKGSARSVDGVHIRDLLAAIAVDHPDLITKFGGHAMAAGLSIPPDRFERFGLLFNDYAGRVALQDRRTLYSDGALDDDELSLANARLLQEHGPWGQDFPEPLFDDTFQVQERRIVGKGFVRFRLRRPEGRRVITGICFKPPNNSPLPERGAEIHAVYRLSVNDYAGRLSAQLIIEHIM